MVLDGFESALPSERQLRKQGARGNSQTPPVNLHQTGLLHRPTVIEVCTVRDTHSPVQHAAIGNGGCGRRVPRVEES